MGGPHTGNPYEDDDDDIDISVGQGSNIYSSFACYF
jgi:hypothetical protein